MIQGTYKNLHWQWPFDDDIWGKNKSTVIVPVQSQEDGTPCLMFQGGAEMNPSEIVSTGLVRGQRVNAPLSGRVSRVDRDDTTYANVEIETLLSDGTRIFNTFVGLHEVPPKIVKDYRLAQGEWIGSTYQANLSVGYPWWFCWVAKMGKGGGYLYADDFAEDECAGIDFRLESKGVPEMKPSLSDSATPAYIPPAPKSNGLLLLGVAAAAYFMFAKGK